MGEEPDVGSILRGVEHSQVNSRQQQTVVDSLFLPWVHFTLLNNPDQAKRWDHHHSNTGFLRNKFLLHISTRTEAVTSEVLQLHSWNIFKHLFIIQFHRLFQINQVPLNCPCGSECNTSHTVRIWTPDPLISDYSCSVFSYG